MSKKKPEARVPLYDVQLLDPKPNPLFDKIQTAITQFVRYTGPVACAHCGRRSKHHWTQLRFFRVMEEASFTLKPSEKIYPPLSPVCRNHILAPEMPK